MPICLGDVTMVWRRLVWKNGHIDMGVESNERSWREDVPFDTFIYRKLTESAQKTYFPKQATLIFQMRMRQPAIFSEVDRKCPKTVIFQNKLLWYFKCACTNQLFSWTKQNKCSFFFNASLMKLKNDKFQKGDVVEYKTKEICFKYEYEYQKQNLI